MVFINRGWRTYILHGRRYRKNEHGAIHMFKRMATLPVFDGWSTNHLRTGTGIITELVFVLLFTRVLVRGTYTTGGKTIRRANVKGTAGPEVFAILLVHTSGSDTRCLMSK